MILEVAGSFILQAAAQGLVEQVASGAARRSGEEVVRQIARRWKEAAPPVNHDLQRAVRRSYLQATLVACHACLSAEGVEPRRWRRGLRGRRRRSTVVRDLDELREGFEDELSKSRKPGYRPARTPADDRADVLVEPSSGDGEGARAELRSTLIAAAHEELAGQTPPAPDVLREAIEFGWQAEGAQLDWFELMCGFFVQELKTDTAVQRVFTDTLLKDTSLRLEDLTDTWRSWAGDVVQRLDLLNDQVQEVLATNAALREQLDTLRPALLALSDVDAQLRELRRQPLYLRYAADETADRVEQTIEEHFGTAFVGRADDLERLDRLREAGAGLVVVTAPAGSGKSALLAHWIRSLQRTDAFVAYHVFRQGDEVSGSITNALRNLVRQLCVYFERPDETIPDERASLRELLRGLVLQEQRDDQREPLVLVIDALDEADGIFDSPFHPPLPDQALPPNTLVVVSARAEAGEEPRPYLERWTTGSEELPLPSLDRADIARWLSAVPPGVHDIEADDPLVLAIEERTDGLPLFLRHLVEDIAHAEPGTDLLALIAAMPTGFTEYVGEQWPRVAAAVGDHREAEQLFGLLVVAVGPLTATELKALTGISVLRLENLPWQVERWFSIRRDPAVGLRYRFAHPLLADAFEQRLGTDAVDARERLVAWCGEWHEHKSAYALRHLADHLAELARDGQGNAREELYSLARDEDLVATQLESLPDEPELPLRTLHQAIRAAADADDVPTLADFVLLHARRLDQLRLRSPLRALRDSGLETALALADRLYDSETSSLWHLLLAWELMDAGSDEDALTVLRRITGRGQSVPLHAGRILLVAVLVVPLIQAVPPLFDELVARLLPDDDGRDLLRQILLALAVPAASMSRTGGRAGWLVAPSLLPAALRQPSALDAQDLLTQARKVGMQIRDPATRVAGLLFVAEAQVDVAVEDARETLATAHDVLAEMEDGAQSGLLAQLVRVSVLAGAAEVAAEYAGKAEPLTLLRELGSSQVSGEGAIEAARQAVERMSAASLKAIGLLVLARLESRSAEPQRALASLQSARDHAARLPDGVTRGALELAVALELVRLGHAEDGRLVLAEASDRLRTLGYVYPLQASSLLVALRAIRARLDEGELPATDQVEGYAALRRVVGVATAEEAQEREKLFSSAIELATAVNDPLMRLTILAVLLAVLRTPGRQRPEAKDVDLRRPLTLAVEAARAVTPRGRAATRVGGLILSLGASHPDSSIPAEALGEMVETLLPEEGAAFAAGTQAAVTAKMSGADVGPLVDRARKDIAAIEEEHLRWEAWSVIAEALANAGDTDEALEALTNVHDDGDRLSMLAFFARLRAEVEDDEGALELLEKAAEDGKFPLCSDVPQALETLAALWQGRGEHDRSATARSTAREVDQRLNAIQSEALVSLATSLAEIGYPTVAREVAATAPDPAVRASSLLERVPELMEAGETSQLCASVGLFPALQERCSLAAIAEFAKVTETDLGMDDLARASGLRDEAQGVVAVGQARAGDSDAALARVSRVTAADAAFWRAATAVANATAEYSRGRADGARAALEVVLTGLEEAPGAWTLSSLADAALLGGDLRAARDIAEQIPETAMRTQVLRDLQSAAARAARSDVALEAPSELPGRDELAERAVRHHLEARERDKAIAVGRFIRDEARRARVLAPLLEHAPEGPPTGLPSNGAQAAQALKGLSSVESARAADHARAGRGAEAIAAAQHLVRGRSQQVTLLATQFLLHGDLQSFKEIIVPLCFHWETAYDVCEILARFYPEHAGAVGRAVAGRAA
jgi:hypothetical protein